MTPLLDLSPEPSAEQIARRSGHSGEPARRSSELNPGTAGILRPHSSQSRDPENGSLHSPHLGSASISGMSNASNSDAHLATHSQADRRSSGASQRNWARKSAQRAPTVFARDRAIEKNALVETAERIYLRYLLPGAEREIYLPPALRLTNFPVSTENKVSPLIPDLFHAQKLYIFRALEQDAFPRFLRAKAFGNLTPTSALAHLVLGLLVLWGAFVLAFTFIFLDWKPRLTRLWVILPFFFAFNFLLSAYYSLNPILAMFFQSETTPFRLITVRETYVRKLLLLRALWIEALVLFLTAVFTVIFTVVPGHRL